MKTKGGNKAKRGKNAGDADIAVDDAEPLWAYLSKDAVRLPGSKVGFARRAKGGFVVKVYATPVNGEFFIHVPAWDE